MRVSSKKVRIDLELHGGGKHGGNEREEREGLSDYPFNLFPGVTYFSVRNA